MTLSMRVGHLIPPTHFGPRQTYRPTYISREISIEHPSVGLALLSQLNYFTSSHWCLCLLVFFSLAPSKLSQAAENDCQIYYFTQIKATQLFRHQLLVTKVMKIFPDKNNLKYMCLNMAKLLFMTQQGYKIYLGGGIPMLLIF